LINQRKRVAKRLASGLMAGALALGGLAISGSAPAGAIPLDFDTDQRVAGADRYETSADAAAQLEAIMDDAGAGEIDTVIVASGENFPDALAASALSYIDADENAPILLVKADEIPDSVAYRMNRLSGTVTQVWVIGGESSISEDVFSELEDIFEDAGVDRLAGDNRYETASEVASEVGLAGGEVIIASGENFADAVSVGAFSASTGIPVLLANSAGLPDETVSVLEDIYDAEPATEVYIVGGTAAVASVEDDLVDLGFHPGSVSRIAGPDRYMTNLLWNVENFNAALLFNKNLAGADSQNLLGQKLVFVSGQNYPDALSAAPLAANLDAHIILVKPDSLGTAAAVLASYGTSQVASQGNGTVTAALTDTAVTAATAKHFAQDLWVVGGTSAVSDSVVDAFEASVSQSVTCSVILSGGNDNAQVEDFTGTDRAIVSFSTNLSSNTNADAYGLDATDGEVEELFVTNPGDYFEVNGAGIGGGDSALGIDLTGDGFVDAALILFEDNLEEGDTVSFAGLEADTEDYANGLGFGIRNINECEGDVPVDTTRPTMTIQAIEGGDDAWVTFSESLHGAVDFDSTSVTSAATDWAERVEDMLETGPDGNGDASFSFSCVPADDAGSRSAFYCDGGANVNWQKTDFVLVDDVGIDSTYNIATLTDDGVDFFDAAGNSVVVTPSDGEVTGFVTDSDEVETAQIESLDADCESFDDPNGTYAAAWAKDNAVWAYLGGEAGETTFGKIVVNVAGFGAGFALALVDLGNPDLSANDTAFVIEHQRGLRFPIVEKDGDVVTVTIDRFFHDGGDVVAAINHSSVGSGNGSFAWLAADIGAANALLAEDKIGDEWDVDSTGGAARTKSCMLTMVLDQPMKTLADDPDLNTLGDVAVRIDGRLVSVTWKRGGIDESSAGDVTWYALVDDTTYFGEVEVEIEGGNMDATDRGSDSATATIS